MRQPVRYATQNTAIECTACDHKSPIIVESHLALFTSTGRMHCPLCNNRTSGTQTDVHHIQAMHANLPYIAIKLGLQFMTALSSKPRNRAKYGLPNASLPTSRREGATSEYQISNAISNRLQLEAMYMDTLQNTTSSNAHRPSPTSEMPSNGVCFVHVVCTTCAASCTITRNAPYATTTGPSAPDAYANLGLVYCPFCGSNTLHVQPTSTEETAWLVLSEHYNIPVVALQVLYTEWTTNSAFSHCHSFGSFLNAFSDKANTELATQRTNKE